MRKYSSGGASAWQAVLAVILLTVIGMIIYANIYQAPFVFDDTVNITENPFIRMNRFSVEALNRVLQSRSAHRPLANFSFAVNYFVHGYDVRGYHIVNLIIHIITALLVWLVTRQTLRLCGSDDMLIPFLASILWLAHPLHTQSVTYIVQRMNSMATMFYMLALFCYITARINGRSERGRFKRYFLFFLCFCASGLGLISKEIVATLPISLLLYEWFFFQGLDRNWIKKQIPWVCLAAIAILILGILYMGLAPLDHLNKMYDKHGFTLGQRLLSEAGIVIYYISLLIFPDPGRLVLDYDFPLSTGLIDPLFTILALTALLALFTAAIYSARRHRLLSFSIFWFFTTLLIESSIIGLDLIYEHRTYLPSIFPVIGLVWLLMSHIRPRAVIVIVLCLIIGTCSVGTYRRNKVWSEADLFWQDIVVKSPQKSRPYANLGAVLLDKGDLDQARGMCLKAIHLDPENADANNLLGVIQLRQDRPDKALPFFNKAVKLKPDSARYIHNLGVALEDTGQTEEAMRLFTEIIDRLPCIPETYYHLARIYVHKKNLDEAAIHYQNAISLQPNYALAYNDLGIVRLMQKKTSAAINAFEKAIAIDPDCMSAYLNLTLVLLKQDPEKALAHAVKASLLTQDNPKPHILAAEILTDQGKKTEAIAYYEKAVSMQAGNPKVFYNLACLYALQNQQDKAIVNLKNAVNAGYNNWGHLIQDKDLENIRDTDYYKSLFR